MVDITPTPETMEVDMPDVGKVVVAKDVGEKLIKSRDSLKEANRKAGERLGALESEKKTAEAAVAKAAEEKALAEAMKAGEIEKVREISNRKITSLSEKYRGAALERAISANANIVPEAAADIAAQLAISCRYDLDTDALLVSGSDGKPRVDKDGKPFGVDALIAEFVENRPYLRKASGTSGSGAGGSGSPKSGQSTNMAGLMAMEPKARAKFFADGGKLTD